MASELIVQGYLNRETEFTHGLMGDCGPNAFHVLASWSDNKYYSTYTMYQQMRAHVPPLCGTDGDATGNGLRTYALTAGFTVASYYGYVSDTWSGWLTFVLKELDAGRPVLIELAVGQNLKDWLTGKGENATNLKYHYITLVGYNSGVVSKRPEAAGKGVLPNGFWAADGDSFDSGSALQFIPFTNLSAAKPCMALSIQRRVALTPPPPPPPPSSGGSTVGVPTGWKDDGSTLTAPNGKTVRLGFRDYILAHTWEPNMVPLTKEYLTATGSEQDFRIALTWTKATNSLTTAQGPEFADQLAAANASVTAEQQQVTQAQAAQQAAEAQLASAQQALAVAQQALAAANAKINELEQEGAMTPAAQAAVDYVKALIAQQAAASAADTSAQAAQAAEAKAIAAQEAQGAQGA